MVLQIFIIREIRLLKTLSVMADSRGDAVFIENSVELAVSLLMEFSLTLRSSRIIIIANAIK